ncbi:MAG: fructose-bisphosphatase class II, partial [Candidatus Omnitrophica bacterium]|nr:fructose-bisphosphatase class II [Candidatus Omnitrophota bacterium]
MKKLKKFWSVVITAIFLLNTVSYPAYGMKKLIPASRFDENLGASNAEFSDVVKRLASGTEDEFEILKQRDFRQDFQPSIHFRIGDEPVHPESIPYGISARASTATAAVLIMINLRGAAIGLDRSNPHQKKQISLIKDIADSAAKRIYERAIKASNIALSVRVSEGFGRDGVEESFKAAEVVNPGGELPRDGIMDVIEGTNMFVTNVNGKSLEQLKDSESGATSIMISGEGVESLGNCPDYYADGIFTVVPKKKRQGFLSSPLDPELIAENPAIIENYLFRIAEANNINIGDLEVVLMDREREKERLKVLEGLQKKYSGLEIVTIGDGTVPHNLLAIFGKKEGKHKVVMTVGGAPESFFSLATASTFAEEGALASLRIYSKNVNKTTDGKEAKDLKGRYNFDAEEKDRIKELRPQDYEEIISGNKLFTQQDVLGDVKGSMAFITHNGVFRKSGAQRLVDGRYKVQILRFGKITEGKPCVWFDEQVFAPEELSFAENILTAHEIKDLLVVEEYSKWFRNLKKSGVLCTAFNKKELIYLAEQLSMATIEPDNAEVIEKILKDEKLVGLKSAKLIGELAWLIHTMRGFMPIAKMYPVMAAEDLGIPSLPYEAQKAIT